MTLEECDKIIELFEAVFHRPVMYTGNSKDYSAMIHFVAGFHTSLEILGKESSVLGRVHDAYSKRGWTSTYFGAVTEMKSKGFSDDEVTKELVSVEIELWKAFRNDLK